MIYFRHDDAGAIVFEVAKVFEIENIGRPPEMQVIACATIDCTYGLMDAEDSIEALESWIENCGSLGELIDGSEIVREEIDDFQDFLIKKILYKASKN